MTKKTPLLPLLLWATIAAGLLTPAATPAAEKSDAIKVMSFNVRTSTSRDGDDAWPKRKDLLLKTIKTYDPDLLGTQEVRPDQHDFLLENLPDYAPVGVGRDDGKRGGEFSLILVRKARFDVEDSGTFWLSEHPEEPGSKSWDTALTRICSWALVKERGTAHEFLYANTHFDHMGPEARRQSALLLKKRLPELAKGKPIVLTGDFNCHESDAPYKALAAGEGAWTDSYREVHPKPTTQEASFNGFKPVTAGKRIDFIFHTPELRATASDIDRTHGDNGRLPSDHYPVTATLTFAD